MSGKNICGFISGLCVSLLLCGCFMSTEPYKEVNHYDLGDPGQLRVPGVNLSVGLFRLEAPTKYKMIYRVQGNRLLIDDYNKWAQPPGLLLARYIQSAFSKGQGDVAASLDEVCFTLTGSIFIFEIDIIKKEARLGVRYEIKGKKDQSDAFTSIKVFTSTFEGNTPEAFAGAMSEAAFQFAKTINAELAALMEREKRVLLSSGKSPPEKAEGPEASK